MSHTKEGFDAYVIFIPSLSYISALFLRRNGKPRMVATSWENAEGCDCQERLIENYNVLVFKYCIGFISAHLVIMLYNLHILCM